MPNAMQLMAKAAQDAGLSVDGTVKELMDLMQQGKVMADKVLPHFAKRMRDAADKGLEKALEGNRVAMNRLITTFQMAGNEIYKSGLSEGLTEFFNTSASSVKEMEAMWKSLGRILGSIFKGLSELIRRITPIFVALGEVLQDITGVTKEFSAAILVLLSPTVLGALVSPKIRVGLAVIAGGFARILTPVLAITQAIKVAAFWMEELLNIFTQRKIGLLFDPRKDKDALDGMLNLAKMLTGKGRDDFNVMQKPLQEGTIISDFLPEEAVNTLKSFKGIGSDNNLAQEASTAVAFNNPLIPVIGNIYRTVDGFATKVSNMFSGETPTMGNSTGNTLPREYVDRTPIPLQIDGQTISTIVVESSTFRRGVKLVNSETN